jgi:hypothetical protein
MQRHSIKRGYWLLIGVCALLAAVAVQRFQPLAPRPAQAWDNPVENRQEMIGELKKINERLDRLIAVFEGGKVKVTVANADEIRPPAAKNTAGDGGGVKDHAEEPKIIIKRKADAEGE